MSAMSIFDHIVVLDGSKIKQGLPFEATLFSTHGLLCLMVCHILHVLPYHLLLLRGLCLHALMTRHIAIHS
jgi:hypothetical protein